MPDPCAVGTAELGTVLIDAIVYCYLAGVASRSLWFPTTSFLAVWLLVFAPTYCPLTAIDLAVNTHAMYFFIPAGALLASFVGVLTAKVLNIGQLIDVTLTGSGGGDNSQNEELNVPYIVFALALAFVGVFFYVASVTGAAFVGGAVLIDPTLATVFAVIALLLAFATLIVAGVQHKFGLRYVGARHDYLTVYYTFALLAITMGRQVLREVGTPTSLLLGSIVIVVGDIFFLSVGVFFERARDVHLDIYPGGTARNGSARRGRLYYLNGSLWIAALRILVILVVHLTLYLAGGLFQIATGNAVAAMFDLLRLPLLFFVLYLLGIIVYAVYLTCCGAASMMMLTTDSSSAANEDAKKSASHFEAASFIITTSSSSSSSSDSNDVPRKRKNAGTRLVFS